MKLFARLILGLVFVMAGASKMSSPSEFAEAISHFRILPASLIPAMAMTLPWIELNTGALLIVGFLTDSCALILGILSATFALALFSALMRGLDIQCGCFKGNEPISWLHPILDAGLAALAYFIFREGHGIWALDGLFASPSLPLKKKKVKKKIRV